jgi:hypothetical protein
LAAIDQYQQQLQDGMHSARGAFLAMLVHGGIHLGQDIVWLEGLITPDGAKLSPPVLPEERSRILSPVLKQQLTLGRYVPIPQETDETFKKGRPPPEKSVTKGLGTLGAANQVDVSVQSGPVELYHIPPRSYRLINHLFQNGQTPQGQVTFQDFGRFMAALNFGQIALGGSLYRFFQASDEAQDRRSIVVHKRHPDPAFRLHDLRSIGRRLSNRFGWTADTFEAA